MMLISVTAHFAKDGAEGSVSLQSVSLSEKAMANNPANAVGCKNRFGNVPQPKAPTAARQPIFVRWPTVMNNCHAHKTQICSFG